MRREKKGKQWQPALALFDRMAKAGVARDRVTYNAVIRACERGGEYKLAMDLRMEAAGALGAPAAEGVVKDGGSAEQWD